MLDLQKACNKLLVIHSITKYCIIKFLLNKQFWSIVCNFACRKNANTVESPFPPPTTFCVYIRRCLALLGTVWLPECDHIFNHQSRPRGFQTTAWQINSIILLLVFNFYVKTTYIVTLPTSCTSFFQRQTFSKPFGSKVGTVWTVGLSCWLFWYVLVCFLLSLYCSKVSPRRHITQECC